jgi:hypothetical protein
MKKRTSTAVLALALLVATPGAAFADSSSSSSSAEQATPAVDKVINSPEATAEKAEPASPEQLAALKAKASAEIAKRQASLTGWVAKLAAAKADCGQNGPAAARIAATQASLNTLGAAIQAAPTREAAKPLYRQIFTHQRVYLVVGPVVGIALACDGQAVRADKLTVRLTELQTKASTAAAGGANTAAAVALLNQVAPLIATGKASATAAAASVNGLAPDQGVEAVKVSNSAAVNAARAQMKQSDASLDAAGRLLNDASKALGGSVKSDRKTDRKSDKEAAKDAEKAKREQAKQDKKNQKDKEKEERKDRKEDKDDDD